MTRPLIPILFASAWLVACAGAPPPAPVEDKLDGLLMDLLHTFEHSGPRATLTRMNALQSNGLEHDGLSIQVDIITTASDAVPLLKTFLLSVGGRYDTDFENHIYGWIPLPELRNYANHQQVWSVNASIPTHAPLIKNPTAPNVNVLKELNHDQTRKTR